MFTFDGASCLLESPPYPGAVPAPKTLRARRDAGILGPSAVGTLKHGVSVRDRMQHKGNRTMTEASGGGGRTELERTLLQRSLKDDSFRQRLLFNWDKPRNGGSEGAREGPKILRSAASCRRGSALERPRAVFQTVSEGFFSKVR